MAVATLLTFCPPAPCERMALSSISCSGMLTCWEICRLMNHPDRRPHGGAGAPALNSNIAGIIAIHSFPTADSYPMSTLMALAFQVAGVFCIHRPARIAAWLAAAVRRAGGGQGTAPAWAQGRGTVLFIRFIGLLALLIAVLLMYVSSLS